MKNDTLNTMKNQPVNDNTKTEKGSYIGMGKGSNPNSRKNLISLADRTKEEREAIGRKGGIKNGEKIKARKSMKDTILDMISQEIDPKKLEKMGVDISTLNGDYTFQGAIISAMLREAVNGDTKAMQLLRDTIGEMPTVKTENRTEVITKEDLETISNLKDYLTG